MKYILHQENVQFIFGIFDVFAETSKMPKDVKTWHLYKARYMSPKDAHSLWKMFFIFQRCTTSLWSMSLDIFALANSIPIFFLVDFQQIYKMDLSTRYSVLKLLHRTCSVCAVVTWSSPSHCHSIVIVLIKLLIWALNYLSEPKQHLAFCMSLWILLWTL